MRFPDATQIPTVKTMAAAMAHEYRKRGASQPDLNSLPQAYEREHEIEQDARSFSRLAPLVGYLVIFGLTYAVELAVPFAFLDDYPALASTMRGNLSSEVQARLAGGRPVLALLFDWLFRFVHSLGGLRLGRFVGIVSVAVLAWMLYLALTHAKVDRRIALLLPVLIGTLPTFQVYVSWSIASIGVSSCIVSGLGLLVAEVACRHLLTWQAAESRGRMALVVGGYAALAIVLLLIGLATAQTTGLYYWVFAGIYLIAANYRLPQTLLRFAVYLAVAAVAMGLEFVLVEVSAQMPSVVAARDALVTSSAIPAKFSWFIESALYTALNLWQLSPSVPVAVLVSVLITGGLLLYFPGGIVERLVRFVLALALLPLGYTANLVVAEDWASYRSQVVLSSILALYVGLAVLGIVRWVSSRYPSAQRIATVVLVGASALTCLIASASVAMEFAIPNYVEYNTVLDQLHNQSLVGKQRVYFIQANWADSIAPFVRFDEFGLPSSYAAWTPSPMMYVALSQADPADENLPVVIAQTNPDGTVPPPPPDSIVINMHGITEYNHLSICIGGVGFCNR